MGAVGISDYFDNFPTVSIQDIVIKSVFPLYIDVLFHKQNVPMAHSRAEARLLQQPSTTAPSAHPAERIFLS